MDPLTALGTASSIVQLVSFSHGLLSSAKEIASSAGGTSMDIAQLRLLVENVQESAKEFAKLIPSQRSRNAVLLHDIARECDDVAEILVKKLSKLQVKRKGFSRRVEAFAIAGRYLGTRDEIHSLSKRLFELEARLSQWWQAEAQHQNYSSLAEKINTLTQKMEELGAHSPRKQLEERLEAVSRIVDSLGMEGRQPRLSSANMAVGNLIKEDGTRLENLADEHRLALHHIQGAFLKVASDIREVEKQENFIRHLSSEQLMRRRDAIPEAHRETLRWVFEPERTHFKQWLQNGEGVFWVKGLAGSGKSTLMKFVADEPQTRKELESWAPPSEGELIIASHYFWNSGMDLEKSQQGLLRALLFQLIRSAPSLVGDLFPGCRVGEITYTHELRAAFGRLCKLMHPRAKFCFFIDGLDEFDGAEEDIIKLVKELAAADHIKVCVSSRPWPAFQNEWDGQVQCLQVQDFTKPDMNSYIREMLSEDVTFKQLARNDRRYNDLVTEVSKRAQGVWLWVFLVVRDLLRDMRDKEPYDQLMIRLNAYPQELDRYFEHMMRRIDKVYQAESAQILLIAEAAAQPFSLLGLQYLPAWADLDSMDPDPASARMTDKEADAQVEALHDQWKRRLQNRCRDLLKITKGIDSFPCVLRYNIEFLHRTVRDFLREKYHDTLCQRAPEGFSATIFNGRVSLLLMKRLPRIPITRTHEWALTRLGVEIILTCSRDSEGEKYLAAQVPLLDGLDGVLRSNQPCWELAIWGLAEYGHGGRCPPNKAMSVVESLFSTAIKWRLYGYVRSKLEEEPGIIAQQYGRPALDCALHTAYEFGRIRFLNSDGWAEDHIPSVDYRIVKLLLESGADPSQKILAFYGVESEASSTPFIEFIASVAQGWSSWQPRTQETVFEVIKLLLKHGADPIIPSGTVSRYGRFGKCSIIEHLNSILGPSKTTELDSIVAEILAARKTGLISRLWQWAGPLRR